MVVPQEQNNKRKGPSLDLAARASTYPAAELAIALGRACAVQRIALAQALTWVMAGWRAAKDTSEES